MSKWIVVGLIALVAISAGVLVVGWDRQDSPNSSVSESLKLLESFPLPRLPAVDAGSITQEPADCLASVAAYQPCRVTVGNHRSTRLLTLEITADPDDITLLFEPTDENEPRVDKATPEQKTVEIPVGPSGGTATLTCDKLGGCELRLVKQG